MVIKDSVEAAAVRVQAYFASLDRLHGGRRPDVVVADSVLGDAEDRRERTDRPSQAVSARLEAFFARLGGGEASLPRVE